MVNRIEVQPTQGAWFLRGWLDPMHGPANPDQRCEVRPLRSGVKAISGEGHGRTRTDQAAWCDEDDMVRSDMSDMFSVVLVA